MSNETILDKKGFAKVPHGIADAAISDTLKLLLLLCYDRPADWTYSVAEVARTMDKSKQCIREYFRMMIKAGVFRGAGEKRVKHGTLPIYTFQPDKVEGLVRSQLKVNPETNPEMDVETNPETNSEISPATRVSHTNTNLPRSITKNEGNEIESTKEPHPTFKESGAPVKSKGEMMAEEFDRLFDSPVTIQSQPLCAATAVAPMPSRKPSQADLLERTKRYYCIV